MNNIKKKLFLEKLEKEEFFKDIIISDIDITRNNKRKHIKKQKVESILAEWVYKNNLQLTEFKKLFQQTTIRLPVEIKEITKEERKISVLIQDKRELKYTLKLCDKNVFEIIKVQSICGIEEKITQKFIIQGDLILLKSNEESIKEKFEGDKRLIMVNEKENNSILYENCGQKVSIKYPEKGKELTKIIKDILWSEDWNIYRIKTLITPMVKSFGEGITMTVKTDAHDKNIEELSIKDGVVEKFKSNDKIICPKERLNIFLETI